MKKFILLLMFFAMKNIISQNGWVTYSTAVPSGTTASTENVIFIDNAGNKWVGFTGSGPNGTAIAKYDNASNTWTFWTKTTMALPSSTVSSNVKALAQDNLGNIWIGTTSGLIKYDGVNFIRFTTTNGLPNNYIACLEFSNNMLYIGTQGGLSRYDGVTFTNYTIGNGLFPINSVLDIKSENPNTLWATTYNTLVKFYINSSFTSTSYSSAVATTSLSKIYIDAAGMKWISGSSGIVKYDNVNFYYMNTMYPNFTGVNGFDGQDIGKGPNNGILITARLNTPSYNRCLVEFLPSGNYNLYYSPPTIAIENSFENDATGKLWMTGSVASLTPRIHSFSGALYNSNTGNWWGPGINSDNFKYLDINRVKAGIMNRGDMWWDLAGTGNASYEVPKGSGANSSFAGALWIGGLDASNQLHIAGQTYRQSGNDFWPGPLDTTNASIDSNTVMKYDNIWKVDYNDINNFITQFNLGNVPLTYTPTPDIVNWPAHGTGNNSRYLAPFVDVNGDGIYDWKQGDYPKIKGDQCLYYIFNDNFATHTETKGLQLGLEVHAMAYAYGCPTILNGRNELAYTTFYDYKIYNRSSNIYNNVYIGFMADPDLGNYSDDYIGSSEDDDLGFCYNADAVDENISGTYGYDSIPPAIGLTLLKGPEAPAGDGIDNDKDGMTDELGECWRMTVFDYYNNNIGSFNTNTTNPGSPYQYYNYLLAKWKDSTDFTCGGNAYGGTTKTNYIYPWTNYIGNPCSSPWTESTAGNLAGDRRFILSSGPFVMFPNSSTEVEYAYVWSVDSSATSNINLASVNKLITDAQKIRSFYSGSKPSCLIPLNVGIKENVSHDQFSIYPNPANSTLSIRSESSLGRSVVSITDVLGKVIIENKYNDLYYTSLNIEQLNSGVYFISITTEKGQSVKKFVKQ
jgi:hypothetical protein